MTHRERAVAAMTGERVDRIPFIARMDLWHSYCANTGTLPRGYEDGDLWRLQRDLGVGIFGFGAWSGSFFRLDWVGTDVVRRDEAGTTVTEYRTPRGVLTERERMAEELKEAAGSGARIEFPFKGPKDYPALRYMLENARVVDTIRDYAKFVDAIGEDGVALPWAGHLPAHQLMLRYMGYERFYCELADNPREVGALLEALTDHYRQVLRLAARCTADAVEAGGNFDEDMTPPPVFDRWFAPLCREARKTLDAAGKVLVVHGDGEMRGLLGRLRDCGVRVVEALTPAPMTSIDLGATRALWGDAVCLWGGIASVTLTPAFSDAEFDRHLEDLFRAVAPGDNFILGFGDNVPTDALFHRIQRAAEFWKERGAYPLK
jgi:uroporphyrinogen-III decarboxylase